MQVRRWQLGPQSLHLVFGSVGSAWKGGRGLRGLLTCTCPEVPPGLTHWGLFSVCDSSGGHRGTVAGGERLAGEWMFSQECLGALQEAGTSGWLEM